MDCIVKVVQSDRKTPSIPSEDNNSSVTAQLRPLVVSGPAKSSRSKTLTNKSDKEEKGKGFLDRVKGVVEALQPPPMVKPVSSSTVHSKFAIGDHVVLQPVDSAPIRGIVRWVGSIKTIKDTGGIRVIPVKTPKDTGGIPVVGVETVSTNY